VNNTHNIHTSHNNSSKKPIPNQRKRAARISFSYLSISILCALLGAIYELFSHEIYSYYMIYAFAFPLVGGAYPFLIIALTNIHFPKRVTLNMYNSGIATLTFGSIFEGILYIYGTTNRLSQIYWIVGIAFVVVAIIKYIFEKRS
jgi:hypothetical protein